MEPKTQKLLRQAGKYVLLGKLTLALEQYFEIHELEPNDTTIINTIAELYGRLENKDEALNWYQKLAEAFEYRELFPNAIATYRKILKISPKNQEALVRMANLYERQGQIANAKHLSKILAEQLMSSGQYEKAIETYQRICRLDPSCPENRLELARILEKFGKQEEASQAFLICANQLAEEGDMAAAATVTESIFRLKVQNKEFLKSFFKLLQEIDLVEQGMNYLHSLSLDQDPDIKVMLFEVFLQQGDLEPSQRYLLEGVCKDPRLYPATLKLLQELIAKKNLDANLEVAEALIESAIQLHDEVNLKVRLDSLIEVDPSNIRTLKILTALLIRMNDRQGLEGCLKRLVILELQDGNLREGRDNLNKLAACGQNNFYVDLLSLLDKGMCQDSSQNLQEVCQQVIQALRQGSLVTEEPMCIMGKPVEVADLDLGMGLGIEVEEDLFAESRL